jgi:opacity protein-like surface antigen
MIRLTRFAVLSTLLAVTPFVAHAQSSSSMELNIGAGLALPTSTFGDRNDAGYNLIVGIGTMPRGSQLGFRAEGIYTEYTASNTSRKSHAGGITGNAIFDLAQGNRSTTNSLYLIGGIGYYQTKEEFLSFSGASENNIGFNVGGGFRFPLTGFSAYLEARYHTVQNTDVKFIPITFGLVF